MADANKGPATEGASESAPKPPSSEAPVGQSGYPQAPQYPPEAYPAMYYDPNSGMPQGQPGFPPKGPYMQMPPMMAYGPDGRQYAMTPEMMAQQEQMRRSYMAHQQQPPQPGQPQPPAQQPGQQQQQQQPTHPQMAQQQMQMAQMQMPPQHPQMAHQMQQRPQGQVPPMPGQMPQGMPQYPHHMQQGMPQPMQQMAPMAAPAPPAPAASKKRKRQSAGMVSPASTQPTPYPMMPGQPGQEMVQGQGQFPAYDTSAMGGMSGSGAVPPSPSVGTGGGDDDDDSDGSDGGEGDEKKPRSSSKESLALRRLKQKDRENRRRKRLNTLFLELAAQCGAGDADKASVLITAIEGLKCRRMRIQQLQASLHAKNQELMSQNQQLAQISKPPAQPGQLPEGQGSSALMPTAGDSDIPKYEDPRRRFQELLGSHVQLQPLDTQADFHSAFMHSSVVMIVTGIDGKIMDANLQAAQQLGYSVSELCEMNFLDFVHPEHLSRALESAVALMSGQKQIISVVRKCIHKNGSTINFHSITWAVRDPNGTPQRTMMLAVPLS